MSITENWKKKLVVLILAIAIATSPLVLSRPSHSESGLVSPAVANKRCPAHAHFHPTNSPDIQVRWWSYTSRPVGPASQHQRAYYWKSQANVAGGRVVKHGYKVC
jgi:hypothetical protein